MDNGRHECFYLLEGIPQENIILQF